MTACIVRIDHFEGLEQTIIGRRGEVSRHLGCQNVEVRVPVSKLLHGLQIQ